MRVTVRFFGVLKDLIGRGEETLDVPAGTTLEGIFRRYSERYETLERRRPSILFARNHEFARADEVAGDDDEIGFLPPVSGGSGRGVDELSECFALTREPLDARALADRLKRPEDGAAVTFEGIVRNNTNGRPTSYLEYECYEALAVRQMARIGREIAVAFEIGRIGMIHRLGRLEVGEASVVVVATAPHRRAAFEAALAGINRLKKEVPIWKKEVFVDGECWVDGEWDEALIRGARPIQAGS